MTSARKTLAAAVALSFLASGCVVYPKVATYHDGQCNIERHRLDMEITGAPSNLCDNVDADECVAALLVIGPMTAALSVPVVLAGNSALWLERKGENYWRERSGHCEKAPVPLPMAALPPPVPATPAPATPVPIAASNN